MRNNILRAAALPSALALVLGVSAISLSPPALAADLVPSKGGINLLPTGKAMAFELRVIGPKGAVHENIFMSGEAIHVTAKQIAALGGDGLYYYEIKPVTGARVRGERDAGGTGIAKASAPTDAGTFRVLKNQVLAPTDPGALTTVESADTTSGTKVSSIGTKDQVILDDLIVAGSICAGDDCVNGEVFDFDTIRLKENNLRIKFQDTSSTSSFPSMDWQLTANDQSNGGANKFSIDNIDNTTTPFTVLGDARNNSIVAKDAKVGFGTLTPVAGLDYVVGNTPTLRLEQDGSQGWSSQSWDVAGNEANFFIRDVTNGSKLPFRIKPGAPTSSLDIAVNGDIGLGTGTPVANLDVSRAGQDVSLNLTNSAGSAPDWTFRNTNQNGRLSVTDDPSGGRVPFKIQPGASNNLVAIGVRALDTVELDGNLAMQGPVNRWVMRNREANGRLAWSDDPAFLRIPLKLGPNATNNLLRVGVTGPNTVDINGNLVVTGSITPDYVFEKSFKLPSIQEHAAHMWEYKHLPKVAPAQVNEDGKGIIDVGSRSQGMLEELEYAHIYIEQLHTDMQSMRAETTSTIQALRAELEAIKAALPAEAAPLAD